MFALAIGEPGEGAVAAMLGLHALDALDPDEAALVDAMLAHRPRCDASTPATASCA